ncbi:MAG: Cysteine dioxygenase type [Thermoplasmata archaeon]|jgi:hypothetical protein|nr:Cysteine dioxygenase type [Thermoplasmata archaeon]
MHAKTSPQRPARPPRPDAPFTLQARRLPEGTGHLPKGAQDGVSLLRQMGQTVAEDLSFPEKGYLREVVQADAEAELIACTWSPGQGTPLHGHGASQTVTRVLQGTVLEERFLPSRDGEAFTYELVELGAGSWSHAGLGVVHRVWGLEKTRTLQCTTPFNGTPVVPVGADLWPMLDEARSRFLAQRGHL